MSVADLLLEVAYTDLSFGAQLVAAGLTPEQVEKLATNIDVTHEGKNISVFDVTEEMDAAEAATLLKSVL